MSKRYKMSTFYTEAVPDVKNKKNRNFGTCQFETATCKMDQQKVDEDKHL